MGYRCPGSAPLSNPSRGKRMAEIVETGTGPRAVASHAVGEAAEHGMDGSLGHWPTARANEDMIGGSRLAGTRLQVALQRRDG